jgi:hypothetical protein
MVGLASLLNCVAHVEKIQNELSSRHNESSGILLSNCQACYCSTKHLMFCWTHIKGFIQVVDIQELSEAFSPSVCL